MNGKQKYTEWYMQHLTDEEPLGHGLKAAYVAKLNVTLAEEHTFQHSRDKRAGINLHKHNEWQVVLV